ncbi:MAG: alpha/beta hydrolase [Burkholderiales bacterium]|nr:alpha/beta hydrolase [Burkholderiales bacterium]
MVDHTAAPPVIIIHGLWMHGLVMALLARRIAHAGFETRCWSYPSMRLALTENADRLAAFCRTQGLRNIHVIAHSMGGLVALRMLERHHDIGCARMVLLGTPYVDSHAAQRLAGWPGGRRLLGRSIAEWLDTPRPVPRAGCVIGRIAGTRALGLGQLVSRNLPYPHDGVVSVAETQLPGATAQSLLPVTHSGLLLSKVAATQCAAFLKNGNFEGVQP